MGGRLSLQSVTNGLLKVSSRMPDLKLFQDLRRDEMVSKYNGAITRKIERWYSLDYFGEGDG